MGVYDGFEGLCDNLSVLLLCSGVPFELMGAQLAYMHRYQGSTPTYNIRPQLGVVVV